MDYVIHKRLWLLSKNPSARHMILPYKILVGEITELPHCYLVAFKIKQ